METFMDKRSYETDWESSHCFGARKSNQEV